MLAAKVWACLCICTDTHEPSLVNNKMRKVHVPNFHALAYFMFCMSRELLVNTDILCRCKLVTKVKQHQGDVNMLHWHNVTLLLPVFVFIERMLVSVYHKVIYIVSTFPLH